jgi:hypothetical protein
MPRWLGGDKFFTVLLNLNDRVKAENAEIRQKTVLKRQKRQKSSFADKNSQASPLTNFHHLGSIFFFFFIKKVIRWF